MALVFRQRVPAAFDDAELNAGVTVTAALELGADTADGRTFTHAGTPLAAERPAPGLAARAEKQKRREPVGRRGVRMNLKRMKPMEAAAGALRGLLRGRWMVQPCAVDSIPFPVCRRAFPLGWPLRISFQSVD
jgi:hypothetical protein